MHMFSRFGLRAIFAACLLCLMLAPVDTASAAGKILHISNTRTGLKIRIPLHGVDRLSIRFFHSYDRQWVVESFRVIDGRFVPSEVRYSDDSYDYRDQRYRSRAVVEPDQVRLTDISPVAADRLRTIAFRIAHIRSQQLELEREGKNKVLLFNRWGSPGDPLLFSIK